MVQAGSPQYSVIVPIGARHGNIAELHHDYKQALAATGATTEFIYVLDGPNAVVDAELRKLIAQGESLTMISLARFFGEATALMAAFERSSGEIIVTLPAYHQIEAGEIPKLLEGMTTADLVIGHRHPRVSGVFEGMRRGLFHGLLGSVTGLKLNDLGCGARVMRRQVLQEISLYGDQHRFLPVLADRQGFRIKEVQVRQSPKDRYEGVYQPKEYTRRFLDIFTVFFLVRFTKKPLRFFGMIGASMFALGFVVLLYLIVARLFLGEALADRPALLLTSLLVVLGLQLFALGLLGELIIFTHARQLKDYQVAEVIQFGAPQTPEARKTG
jgi:hypothetical protein